MRRLAVLLCAVPTLSAAQGASGPDSAALAAFRWRGIGPDRGGRSIAVAGSPQRRDEYYFGAVGGGLWKTVDGGTTWQPVTDGWLRSSSVGAVAVAPSNPDVVYVGMGEVQLRGNILQGDGVYRSTDGGRTWAHLGLAETQTIARIRVHPSDPQVAWVAAFGHPTGPNAERGVFKTTDGGATWRKVLFRGDSVGAADLVVDPRDPRVLYASLWQASRVAWRMSSGGPGSGLFKSVDGGETWYEISRTGGLPNQIYGKIGVAISPADPTRVWAIIEADSGGLFRSDDGGRTWARVNGERKLRQRAFYYSRVVADPVDRERVFVLNVQLWRSDDGGRTFATALPAPHVDHHDLWIDPADPRRMISGNDGGGTVSTTGGLTWTDQDFPTAQPYHVIATRDFPYHACGAQQDNSTFCVASHPAAATLAPTRTPGRWWYPVGGGESGVIAQDPVQPDVFYAGSQGALLTRYDRRSGAIRDVQVYPRFFSGEPASALPERWQWTYPIVFSPISKTRLFVSSQHVWTTTDEGQSWMRVSPDLSRNDPATLGPSGGPITGDMNGPEIYGTVFALAPSQFDSLTLWAGSDDGLVHVTRNFKAVTQWTRVTPPGVPAFARTSTIEASRHVPGGAYVAAKAHQIGDRRPYVFRTTDFGVTWTPIVAGIRDDAFVHVVREDPERAGLLFAGTEHGVYLSLDDGATWRSLSLNLPDLSVQDLVVAGDDLVIATHGRGVWVLDDITPLRQWSADVAAKPLHVYVPRPAIRRVHDATFHYHLAAAADTVRITIADSAGRDVRRYVGVAGRGAPGAPPDCEVTPPAEPNPPARAGLNRFAWDGRFAGAVTFDCQITWGADPRAGPLAPPGRYVVTVEAGGRGETREFVVRRDPRLAAMDDSDLRAQAALAQRILEQENRANGAVVRIRALRAGLGGRTDAAADPVRDELAAIEEALYQVRNRSAQDPLNFPIRLGNRLSALRRSVETGDARPTDNSYYVLRLLTEELDALVRRVEEVERTPGRGATAATAAPLLSPSTPHPRAP
jgi:photosystem II stability/assembly factor-like uncharacterized protein